MGTLNLATFRSELLFDLRNRTDRNTADGVTDDRLTMWLNAGYLHVAHPTVFRHREFQYAYTIPLVNGTNSYVFTPNSGVVISAIRYVSHVEAASNSPTAQRTKLFPKDEQWFQERTLIAGGPPRNYAVRADRILIDPVPGSEEAGQVLVVGAWREPELFTGDGITTVLSTLWDEVVLLAARWRAELHLGYRDLAEGTKLDFVSLINEYAEFGQLHGEDWDWVAEVRTESHMERT